MVLTFPLFTLAIFLGVKFNLLFQINPITPVFLRQIGDTEAYPLLLFLKKNSLHSWLALSSAAHATHFSLYCEFMSA